MKEHNDLREIDTEGVMVIKSVISGEDIKKTNLMKLVNERTIGFRRKIRAIRFSETDI